MKWREHPLRRAMHFLEWFFVGYGVRKGIVFLWILVLLAAGTWVFERPGAVVLQQPSQPLAGESVAFPADSTATVVEELRLEWYEALGFSFKQFLPISIPLLRQYQPAPRWISLYASFHMLFGFVLITAAFATVSGLLRRIHPE